MEKELKPWKLGVSLGLVFAILSFLCALLLSVAPETTFNLANNLFHGVDLAQIAKDVSWESISIGLAEIFIIGFLGGWLFGVIYNKLGDRR